MRIGLVDLDTSHPGAWIPVERELGHEVVGLWDGGSVHPAGYADTFAAEHDVPTVYATLEDMVDDVDCAIIHGCDWDTHVERARPFVDSGKAVLIDKPVAGGLDDLMQIQTWATEGRRITGGSALRFADETAAWLSQPPDERGEPQTVIAGCGVDEFNYGIHAYSSVLAVMGSGVESARRLAGGRHARVELHWQDGRTGMLVLGPNGVWLPFYTTVVTDRGVTQLMQSPGLLYEAILRATLPYLAGDADAPLSPAELVEPERCALAALKSAQEDHRLVRLDELDPSSAYDGASFAAGYRAGRYPPADDIQ